MPDLELTREQMLEGIDETLIDNTQEQITPAAMRALLYQLAHSALFKQSDEQQNTGIPEFNPYGPGPTADDGYPGPDENGNNGTQLTYQDRIWVTLRELVPSTFPDGLIPFPGTVNARTLFKELSPTPVVHQQNTDQGTSLAQFTLGLNSQSQGTTEYRLIGFLADSQRANVAIGARWTYQQDGSDVVELVQCLDYNAPASNPANVWVPVGSGGGVLALYVEDTQLNLDTSDGTLSVDLTPAVVAALGLAGSTWAFVNPQAGAGTGAVGSFERPFRTVAEAQASLTTGSTLYLLGRYTENVVLTKELRLIGLGAVWTGYLEWGTFGASTPVPVYVSGLEFRGLTTILRQNSAARTAVFERCTWDQGGYLQAAGIGTTSNTPADTIILRNCRLRGTHAAGLGGVIRLNQRNDLPQPQLLYVEDCVLSTTANALVTGTAHTDTRVSWQGTTRLLPAAGQPVQAVTRINSSAVLDDAAILVEERTTGGGGPSIPVDVRDIYDVPEELRDAVLAGNFVNGELQGAPPAGSLAGMEFTTNTFGYRYQRGTAGTLVWCRYPKG